MPPIHPPRPAVATTERPASCLILLLALALLPWVGNAGNFSPVRSMNVPRFGHSLVLLNDGQVMAAGGWGDDRLRSVEIFNPQTGMWAPASPLAVARSGHTATVLPDGRVLVAGGTSDGEFGIRSVEIWDPATGVWTDAAPMNDTRLAHQAVLLADGRVLIIGGRYEGTLKRPEVFDPKSGQWSPTTSMAHERELFSATLLPNGKVMVAGGYSGYEEATLNHAEVFDPTTSRWSSLPPMNFVRTHHQATLQKDGTVLVVGGSPQSISEIFDPTTSTWIKSTVLRSGRRSHAQALLNDGTTLVMGGSETGATLASAELFDPATRTWSATSPLLVPRLEPAAVSLRDGRVLCAGGFRNGASVDSVEIFDPQAPYWRMGNPMTRGRYGHQAVLLPDGDVLVSGGQTSKTTILDSAERFSLASGQWAATGTLHVRRTGHQMNLVKGGRVLVTGGKDAQEAFDQPIHCLASAELYDPASGQWTELPPMRTSRFRHSATTLPNGAVLVAGGIGAAFAWHSSAEIFDPTQGTWKDVQSMSTIREGHTAVLLSDGRVLVAGGSNDRAVDVLDTAEIFDPATESWSGVAKMHTRRTDFLAVALDAGNALIIDAGSLRSSRADLFVSPGTWASIPNPPGLGNQATAARLNNGLVLAFGGIRNEIGAISLAEGFFYDPALTQWYPATPMLTGRYGHTATRLPSGAVLVAGGASTDGKPLASTELYGDLAAPAGPPVIAFTAPPSGAVAFAGEPLTLSVRASDPDEAVVAVHFYANSTPLGSSQASPFDFVWAQPAAGAHRLTAEAVSASGEKTVSAPITVEIKPRNTILSVSLDSPPEGASFPQGGDLVMTALVDEAGAAVTNVSFFAGTAIIGSDTTPPFQTDWRNLPAGRFALSAVAWDQAGRMATSAPVNIVVTAPPRTIELTDGDFVPEEWESVALNVRARAEVLRKTSGGNPGAYVEVTLTEVGPGFAQARLCHLKKGSLYDPRKGAIRAIDWSDETKMFVGFGNGEQTGLGLRQAGKYYRAGGGIGPSRSWVGRGNTGLTPSSFYQIFPNADGTYTDRNGPEFAPDFSSQGAPMEFGFVQADDNGGAGSYTLVQGIDNWSVVLHVDPAPPAPPAIESILSRDGTVVLILSAVPGQDLEIQSSKDLTAWTSRTRQSVTSSPVTVSLPFDATGAEFFRAVVR